MLIAASAVLDPARRGARPLGTRIAPATLCRSSLPRAACCFCCEWVVRFSAPAATAMLLYLHTSATGPLLTSGFWLIATERFDPRTAKRRFGQIAGAGTFGGLLGALVAERVAATVGAPAMLLVLGGFQFLTVWLFRGLPPPRTLRRTRDLRLEQARPLGRWGVRRGVLQHAIRPPRHRGGAASAASRRAGPRSAPRAPRCSTICSRRRR